MKGQCQGQPTRQALGGTREGQKTSLQRQRCKEDYKEDGRLITGEGIEAGIGKTTFALTKIGKLFAGVVLVAAEVSLLESKKTGLLTM